MPPHEDGAAAPRKRGGLVTIAAKFKERSGTQVQIRYATAPELIGLDSPP